MADANPSTSADEIEERVFTLGNRKVSTTQLMELLRSEEEESKAQLDIILIEAIRLKHNDIVLFLLNHGIEIRVINEAQQSPIHLTFYYSYLVHINLFFCNSDLKVNQTDVNGLSHFHLACIGGNALIAEHYIREGADVNMRFHTDPARNWDNFTPLHFAAKCARETITLILLTYGANPNLTDNCGRTPLHFACGVSMRYCNVLAEAINDAKSEEQIKRRMLGNTMDLAIVQALVRNGANLHARDQDGYTPLFYLFRNNYHHLMKSMKDAPVSFICCSKTYRQVVREIKIKQKLKLLFMLNSGADVKLKNTRGETVLHYAIDEIKYSRMPANLPDISFDDSTSIEMSEVLMKAGVDVNALNIDGESALQIAVSVLSPEIVKLLLKYNADISIFKKFNHTDIQYFRYPNVLPCYEAVDNLIEIVNTLTEHGMVLNLTEYLGLLKFFIHNNIGCSYADINDSATYDKLMNLFEYGTHTNVLNVIRSIDNRIFTDPNYYVCIFMKLMEAGQFYMHPELNDYIKTHMIAFNFGRTHQAECLNELRKMRRVPLQGYTSLYDFMTMNPHKIFHHLTNNFYKQIFRSPKLKEQFHLYTGIVKGHFTKGIVRRFIVKAASDYIRVLTTPVLPDLVCEKVASYLTNEELWTMCLIATIKLRYEANRLRNDNS